MSTAKYRAAVLGAILSSFLVGTHISVLHEILDHGTTAHWDVLIATAVLVVVTVLCGSSLLRLAPNGIRR
jgi:hypothetical protein